MVFMPFDSMILVTFSHCRPAGASIMGSQLLLHTCPFRWGYHLQNIGLLLFVLAYGFKKT